MAFPSLLFDTASMGRTERYNASETRAASSMSSRVTPEYPQTRLFGFPGRTGPMRIISTHCGGGTDHSARARRRHDPPGPAAGGPGAIGHRRDWRTAWPRGGGEGWDPTQG